MGSRGTWLALALVAAIALAAAADALRDGPGQEPAAVEELAPTTTAPGEDSEPPEAALAGVLYYTDESCRLRAVRLPDLEPVQAPGWNECRFVLSPDGRRASDIGSGWDPHSDPRIGRLFQTSGGTIAVATDRGPEDQPFRGRAAAWRPDGTLTYVARGAVRTWPRDEVVLAADDVVETIRDPSIPEGELVRAVSFQEVAWLDSRRLVVLMRVDRGTMQSEAAVAVFEDRSPLALAYFDQERLSDLRASRAGGFFSFRASTGVRIMTAGGASVSIPRIEGARAVAFSPNERWAAIAGRSDVYLFPLGVEAPPVRRLPIAANDLAWHGPAAAAGALEAASEARAWLTDLRLAGRLLVTQKPGCRLRELRVPELEWAAEPNVAKSSCRFDLSPTGDVVPEGIVVRAEDGVRAECRDGEVEISAPRRAGSYRIPNACAPSWTPDGRLTFVRDGELWEGLRPDSERVLISHEDLGRMFEKLRETEGIAEVAWFDDTRLWAAVRIGGRLTLAAMTTSGLQYRPDFRATRIGSLVTSAGMVAAVTDKGVVILDGGGRRTLIFGNARAVAWAPGELVAAVATPDEIWLVSAVTKEVVPVPLAVEDIEWAER
jgi:hypothetical protein